MERLRRVVGELCPWLESGGGFKVELRHALVMAVALPGGGEDGMQIPGLFEGPRLWLAGRVIEFAGKTSVACLLLPGIVVALPSTSTTLNPWVLGHPARLLFSLGKKRAVAQLFSDAQNSAPIGARQ